MQPFHTLFSRAILLELDDVDTDQIIPARFLTTTSREGLGAHLFADWRFDATGAPRAGFALNRPGASGAQILVAGRNFGCGSSREHAPWALLDYGFRAVVALSFGDIFRANSLKVGLLPITLSDGDHRRLSSELRGDTELGMSVNLALQTLEVSGRFSCAFPIDPFAKRCLLDGIDELGFLLAAQDEIVAYERVHAAPVTTMP